MKLFAAIAVSLALAPLGPLEQTPAPNQIPQFVDMFNGKDLNGWANINTAEDTRKIRDGMVICSGRPIGVMCSETQYENFILHIEWMPDPTSVRAYPTASKSRCSSCSGRISTSATA